MIWPVQSVERWKSQKARFGPSSFLNRNLKNNRKNPVQFAAWILTQLSFMPLVSQIVEKRVLAKEANFQNHSFGKCTHSRAGKSCFCSLWLPNPKAVVIMFQEITSSANSLGLLGEGWRQLMPRKPTEQIRKAYLKSYLGSKFTTTSPVYSSATPAFPGISFFNVWLSKPCIETVMLDKVFYRVYYLIGT